MRILFLTNFFPPARPGGYAQLCEEAVRGLQARGHTVAVLTSNHEAEKVTSAEPDIHRILHLDGDLFYYNPRHFFIRWRKEQRENLSALQRVIDAFEPDLCFVWGMWALSRQLPARAEQLMPGRVVYYLADYWPATDDMHTAYWTSPAMHWYMNLPKRLLAYGAGFLLPREGEVTLQLAHVLTVSKALRDNLVTAGVPIEHAHVVYNGIHLHEFRPARLPDANQVPRRLLYAGQLADHKGVHTAIEAMNRLVHQDGCSDLSLTILGSGHPQYEEWLHTMVRRYQLEQHVLFHERVPRQEIPALLKQHDVLLFPSIYEEPLARMPQEAMAVGLVVVGTTTGGSSELLEDGVNGMAFQAEDAAALSDAVLRLVQNPALFRRLATAGQETIRSRFTLERMVQELEVYLCTVLADGVPQRRELSLAEAV